MCIRLIAILPLIFIVVLTGCSGGKNIRLDEVVRDPKARIYEVSFPVFIEGVTLKTGEEILFEGKGAIYDSKKRTIRGGCDGMIAIVELEDIELVRTRELTVHGPVVTRIDVNTFLDQAAQRHWETVDSVSVQTTDYLPFANRKGAYDSTRGAITGVTLYGERVEIDTGEVYRIRGRLTRHGFDNRRKGKVMGIGGGIAPLLSLSSSSIEGGSESDPGLGYSLFYGHGIDDQNVIALEFNGASRHSPYYSEIGRRTGKFFSGGMHGSQDIIQGLLGICWYHYFKPTAVSPFTVVGAGLFHCAPSSLSSHDPGPGLHLGGGYQVWNHMQVGCYFTFGKTRDWHRATFTHHQISMLLTYVRM